MKANIWRMPARFVAPYAEQDVISTLALLETLNPVLDQERTRNAYRLEVDLLPMVHEMRRIYLCERFRTSSARGSSARTDEEISQ